MCRTSSISVVLAALTSFAAGCGGGGGGDSKKAPTLQSVSPDTGSSKTIWTITGTHLDEDAVVTFDGHEATVLSATKTEMRVTDAFAPLSEAQVMSVEVKHGGKRSSSAAVTGVPDGTMFSTPIWQTWTHATSVARADGKLYVADVLQGVYELDEATGVVSVLGRVGHDLVAPGALTVAAGSLYVGDYMPAAGGTRVLRWEDGGFAPLAVIESGKPIAMAPSATGVLVLTESGVSRVLENGSEDFSAFVFEEFAGIAELGGDVYVTSRGGSAVLTVTTAGTTAAFATVSLAHSLSSDGVSLYVLGNTGITEVDGAGTETPFGNPTLPSSLNVSGTDDLQISHDSDGSLILAERDASWAAEVSSPTAVSQFATGLEAVLGLARIGENLYVSQSSLGCHAQSTTDLPRGSIYELSPTGARILPTNDCARHAVSVTPANELLYVNGSFDQQTAVEVIRFDPVTGTRTEIADQSDGFELATGAVVGSDGSIYVLHVLDPLGTPETAIARISGAEVDLEWVSGSGPASSLSLAAAGSYAYAGDISGISGLDYTGIFRANLATGGEWENVVAGAVVPYVDGITEDGTGQGVYFTDLGANTLLHLTLSGELSLVAIGQDFVPLTPQYDAVAGGIFAGAASVGPDGELGNLSFGLIYITP